MATIGHLWTAALTAACLGSGLACLFLAVARVGSVVMQLTHGVMGIAMAAMLSPWGDPVPAWAGAAAFAVSGAWFASVALGPGPRREARHLTIASAAMVVMYLAGAHSTAPDAAAGGGHAAHGVAGGGVGGMGSVLLVALSLVLAGYFVWHAWTCADRTPTPDAAGRPASAVAVGGHTATRASPIAHAVMSVAMAAMFLGAT